jgi:HEAT repeat protein
VNSKTITKSIRGQKSAKRDIRNLEKVRAIFLALSKFIKAKTIYTNDNPNVTSFADSFFRAFQTFFEDEKELLLTIEQYQIKWCDEIVYDNTNISQSIAFLLYKDNIGELIFNSSVKPAELDQFVDLIKNEIYNPSTHLDVVNKLWESQFTNIYYRVYDDYADGTSGEGHGSGKESQEQTMLANDHKELQDDDYDSSSDADKCKYPLDSIGVYLYRKVAEKHPQANAHQKEEQVQNILESFFTVDRNILNSWQDEYFDFNKNNKLIILLETMLDFTLTISSPSVMRDIIDIITRLVQFIKDESDIPTLTALLNINRNYLKNQTTESNYHTLYVRIEKELFDKTFLLSLANIAQKSSKDALEVLQFYQMIGNDAVPCVCELLANLKDPTMQIEACDTLLSIASDDIIKIIETFNLDNPFEANSAVYLLRRSIIKEVPPIIEKIMNSPNAQVRDKTCSFLVHIGSDKAAQLLCSLLEDDSMSVRMKAFASVDKFKHSSIIERVTSLCFADDFNTKSSEEQMRMFQTLGKLAGQNVLVPIHRMIRDRKWLLFNNAKKRQNKLLAIAALKHIPSQDSLHMLTKLTCDKDKLVRSKAQNVMQHLKQVISEHEKSNI